MLKSATPPSVNVTTSVKSQVAPEHCHSSVSSADMWPCAPRTIAGTELVGTVICAMTTLPEGPSMGFIRKTPPSVTVIPESTVHASKSIPIADSWGPREPSVAPMVSQESSSASSETLK